MQKKCGVIRMQLKRAEEKDRKLFAECVPSAGSTCHKEDGCEDSHMYTNLLWRKRRGCGQRPGFGHCRVGQCGCHRRGHRTDAKNKNCEFGLTARREGVEKTTNGAGVDLLARMVYLLVWYRRIIIADLW